MCDRECHDSSNPQFDLTFDFKVTIPFDLNMPLLDYGVLIRKDQQMVLCPDWHLHFRQKEDPLDDSWVVYNNN